MKYRYSLIFKIPESDLPIEKKQSFDAMMALFIQAILAHNVVDMDFDIDQQDDDNKY